MGKSTLDRSVAFFDKVDGRDKLFKAVQNWSKVLAWWYTVNSLKGTKQQRAVCRTAAAKYRKIASSLSAFRSLNKFFKWLKIYRDIKDALSGASDLSPGDWVGVFSDFMDLWYKVFDNLEWLSKHKVLSYNPDQMEKYSKDFQFWCYAAAIIVSILNFLNAGKITKKERSLQGPEFTAAMRKKAVKAQLDLTKDAADFLRVASGRGIVPGVPKPLIPAFAGVMGTISGSVGAYQTWVKTA